MSLHEIPYDSEARDELGPLVDERVVVAVVPVAEDDLLSAETVGPEAAGPVVDSIHVCASCQQFIVYAVQSWTKRLARF